MPENPKETETFKSKMLFYTTAFFILLGIFSLFAFLFLVPFVIDPAFTTIFMKFNESPALCMTVSTERLRGASNCSWTSCREGCTKELYQCTQILVKYKLWDWSNATNGTFMSLSEQMDIGIRKGFYLNRMIRSASNDYEFVEDTKANSDINLGNELGNFLEYSDEPETDNRTEWLREEAKLYPNVKGCGYPPYLNCTIWTSYYDTIDLVYPCYYSEVQPDLVISHLDMWQNTLNLVYAMGIPIPCFIASVIYLTFAYFTIYNDDEESVPLKKNAENIDGKELDEDGGISAKGGSDGSSQTKSPEHIMSDTECAIDVTSTNLVPNGTTPISITGPLTPNSELNSFGHQLQVKMADEMSRESLDAGLLSNSGSIQG